MSSIVVILPEGTKRAIKTEADKQSKTVAQFCREILERELRSAGHEDLPPMRRSGRPSVQRAAGPDFHGA